MTCSVDALSDSNPNSDVDEVINYITKIPQYAWRTATVEQWDEYKKDLCVSTYYLVSQYR